MKNLFFEFLSREIKCYFRSLTKLGNARICPICTWHFSKFLPAGIDKREDVRCPRCNSLERHRAIWLYLCEMSGIFTNGNMKILHVAPEFCFARKIENLKNISYTSIDLGYGLAKYNEDITALKYKDNTFDIVIILHVLEHIQDERTALCELYRVLKPGGWGILQVPMDLTSEKTIEDSSADTPEKRLAAFGQDDHVRLYGLDIKNRLESVGFKTEYINMWDKMTDLDRIRYRISKDEPFYHIKKVVAL